MHSFPYISNLVLCLVLSGFVLLLTHRVASSVVVVVVGAHLDCRTRTTARLPCKVSRLFVHVVTQLYCFHSGKWSLLEIVGTPGLTIVCWSIHVGPSIHPSVRRSVRPSIFRSLALSFYLSLYLSISISICFFRRLLYLPLSVSSYLSISYSLSRLSLYLYLNINFYLYLYLSIYPSFALYLCISPCLSLNQSMFICMWVCGDEPKVLIQVDITAVFPASDGYHPAQHSQHKKLLLPTGLPKLRHLAKVCHNNWQQSRFKKQKSLNSLAPKLGLGPHLILGQWLVVAVGPVQSGHGEVQKQACYIQLGDVPSLWTA